MTKKTQMGQLKLGDKVFATYSIQDNQIIEELSSTLIDNSYPELLDDLCKKIKAMFKKQPIISDLLSGVILIKHKLDGDDAAVEMIFKQSTGLFNKLVDIDIKKHLKNNDFSLTKSLLETRKFHETHESNKEVELNVLLDSYKGFLSFEDIDDKIESIILEQKSKRLIQKVYSKSYRNLINENTINMFKIFVEKKISLSDINHGFGSKLARYDNVEDANAGLSRFVKELSGWTKEIYLNKAKDMGATIINDENDSLIFKIHNYDQSKELGSGQWCISYEKDFFVQYKEVNNMLFFNYDFSKDPDDKKSMVGFVVNSVGDLIDGYWRDDTPIVSSHGNTEENDQLLKFKNKLPEKYTQKDINEATLDSAVAIDCEQKRSSFLLDYNYDIEKVSVLTSAMSANLFSKTITSQSIRPLCDIYKNTKIRDDFDPVELLQVKETKGFISNYLQSATVIYDDWTNSKKEPILLEKMVKANDFYNIRTYVAKVDSVNLGPLLNMIDIDFDEIENQKKILDILSIYKESKATFPLKFDLMEPLYEMTMMGNTDKTDFIEKIFIMNDGKIPLRHTLRRLNDNLSKPENVLTKESNQIRTDMINLALKHIDKGKLNVEFHNKNLIEVYPHIDKQIISSITKKMNQKKSLKVTP
jgi:hypothetical protein